MITNLSDYRREKQFLVCIDSDGCAFDTMEIKHKECFCPATIDKWGLQAVSRYAREAWEYVNLYSTNRGCSRFHAIVQVLDLLSERKEVNQRGFTVPDYASLKAWTQTAPVLNNDAVEKLSGADHVMARTLAWSVDINSRVAEMVHGIPPFPFVCGSLERLSAQADIVIVSATPREALMKEWHEHGVDQYVSLLGSQENGGKKEIIAAIKGSYAPQNCIMIGDAPGDFKAASDNGILFYPIVPGSEESSWQAFYEHIIDQFLKGSYGQDDMTLELLRFSQSLPSSPPWEIQ